MSWRDRVCIPTNAKAATDCRYGFNGYLTLTDDLLTKGGAVSAGTLRAELGNGDLVEMAVYIVRVNWHGQECDVMALRPDAVLIGMSLLWESGV